MTELLRIIRERRSVRTFDGRPLSAEDREKLEQFIRTIGNPFGVPVRFVLLDAGAYGLSSPVLSGESLYVAGIVGKVAHAEEAFGFSFEQLVLYAWSLGIGTTWIGGTMKRDIFENAAGLAEGEMMPCVSPLGYPAAKRSLRETMMRKAVGADVRMPVEKTFFDGAWGKSPAPEKLAGIADAAEAVRRAPSAVNKQPWRVIATDRGYHFYEKRDKGYTGEKTGDLQRIDVGIALCHFVMMLEKQEKKPAVIAEDPGIPIPEDTVYIATVRCGR